MEKAYSVLFWEDSKFIIRSAWWARELQELLKSLSIDALEFNNIPIIWIFDFDNEWFYNFDILKWDDASNQNYKWLIKRIQNTKHIFSMTLPIPSEKPNLACQNLWKLSMITIESLFTESVFRNFFNLNTNKEKWLNIKFSWNSMLHVPNGKSNWEIKQQKQNFAKFIKNLNNPNDFSEFKPLFEAINYIINWYSD